MKIFDFMFGDTDDDEDDDIANNGDDDDDGNQLDLMMLKTRRQ